jgi:predicted Na+-dependent transporter
MPVITPTGVILGILLPWVFLGIRPLVPWLFGTITLAGALKLQARDLGRALSSPFPLVLFFVTAHIIMPFIVMSLSSLIFKNDPDTVSGFILLYSVPVGVTSFIWVSIFKGDLALLLALLLLDTVLAPVVVPGTVRLLLGTSINVNMTGIVISLVFMIVLPTILGVSVNELSRGSIPALINPWVTLFSRICIPLVVAANAAAAAPKIHFDNPRIWIIITAFIGFSVLSFGFARLTSLAARLSREKQISLFFGAGFRNTIAAMTLGTEFFPVAAALPSVMGIIFQQTLAAILGRVLLGKAGGKETGNHDPENRGD